VGEVPGSTIDEVFRAVETGRADYAVVPVENLDRRRGFAHPRSDRGQPAVKLCGEVLLPIHQSLLRKINAPLPSQERRGGEERLAGIQRVYAHAQSLAQCQNWLNKNLPNVERVSVVSNAEGARLAADDPTAVAIAGEEAAQAYGLDIVVPRIEDEPNNRTRFLVLSDHDALSSGRDKTSLVMSAPNVPGSVVKLLQPLADAGVSMTRFESRPAKGANWEYLFFVDIEGHRDDPAVAAALKEVTARAAMVKLLGSYPAAR